MPLIDKVQTSNIELAIQRAFNIKKYPIQEVRKEDNGLEVNGFAIASQNATELNEVAIGYHIPPYHFVANGKWSCINFNKIKVKWTEVCSQTDTPDGIYNILTGYWDSMSFYPDVMNDKTVVKITPTSTHAHARTRTRTRTKIMVPLATSYASKVIKVPKIRFNKNELESVEPKNISSVSVNRCGIYINRKYRDKTVMVDTPDDSLKIDSYTMTIIYEDNVLFEQNIP